jgi:hypothetical protein
MFEKKVLIVLALVLRLTLRGEGSVAPEHSDHYGEHCAPLILLGLSYRKQC